MGDWGSGKKKKKVVSHSTQISDKRGKRENLLKIPCTQRAPHPAPLEIIHQLDESRLRLLREHRLALDGPDLFHGGGLFLGGGQAADVS